MEHTGKFCPGTFLKSPQGTKHYCCWRGCGQSGPDRSPRPQGALVSQGQSHPYACIVGLVTSGHYTIIHFVTSFILH